MSVPPPPSGGLAEEVLPAGTVLLRSHDAERDADSFNPGKGGSTRFAFFGEPTVSVLYAATGAEAAVFETIFHDTVPGSLVPPTQWRTRLVSALRVERDLRLAQFHSAGLLAHGLTARDLTDTPATAYPGTVQWAEAAHRQGLDGCVYMSRRFNSQAAFVLFGDRVSEDDLLVLDAHPQEKAFAAGPDLAWLADLANRIDVTLGLGL